jgi:tetratricopeptide (TPR) repeat protein
MQKSSLLRGRIHRLLVSFIIIVVAGVGEAAFSQHSEASGVDGLYAEAKAATERGDLQQAIEKFQAILKINPQLGPAYNNLGILYFRQGKLPDAVQAFEAGLRYDKNMPSYLAPLGVSYYQMGQLEKARQVLERAVRLKPDDQVAQLYLGTTLFDLGQQEAGAAALQELIHKSPNDLPALYGLEEMYLKMAESTLRKMETLAPDSYQVHLIHAEIMERNENYDAALVQYKEAAAKEPNLPYAHYNIANVYWEMKRWEQATAEFKEEIAVNPYNGLAYWKLGDILVRTHGDPTQALSYIQRALDLCPDVPQVRMDYGLLLAGQGKYEEAIQQYKQVVQLSPEEEGVHLLLGRAYQKLGRTDEAKTEFAIEEKLDKKLSEWQQSRRVGVGTVQ